MQTHWHRIGLTSASTMLRSSVQLRDTCNTARRPRSTCVVRAGAQNQQSSYKKTAASSFVDKFVKSGTIVGVGSGELVHLAIEEIGLRLAKGSLHSVTAVPSCSASAAAAAFSGVPLTEIGAVKVDLAFEEVDELDLANNAAIKGAEAEPQQPQILALRELAQKAAQYVVLVDSTKVVKRLQGTLPVVIDGEDWEEPAEELDDIFLGDAELWRRPSSGTANARGGDDPYVSPEGHNIVDVKFLEGMKLFGEDAPYERIIEEITGVQGVISHGLLLRMADAAVVAKKDSQPEIIDLAR